MAGYTAATAVEGALARRRITGLGARLDISTMESMLSMHQSTFSRLGAGILLEQQRTLRDVARKHGVDDETLDKALDLRKIAAGSSAD